MADSPKKGSEGVVTFNIQANGAALKDTVQIQSIEVTQAINRIAGAVLVITDGDMPNQDFPVSNEDDFKPGSSIKISVGYASQEQAIFEGIVVRHGISINAQSGSTLIIECKDKAIGMTVARNNQNYVDKKDSDIITSLIGNCAGLSSQVSATNTKFNELVQFNCTDWDFLLTRAEANGMVVCNVDNKVTVEAPKTSGSAVLSVSYGVDLMVFNADIDARYQFKSVTGVSWDIKGQAPISEQVKAQTLNAQGDLSSDDLSAALNLSDFRLQSSTALEKTALKDWATAQQVKSGLARIRGNMTFQGSAKAKIGTLISVAGVGNRFNGDVYVSGVKHKIEAGQWLTEAEFGLSPGWSAEYRDLAAPGASGLMPPVEGLQIGVVKKLDEDPDKQNRIQVSVPVLQASSEGVWARLASYYASADIGSFFIPEIGDEVILGYFNNDPGQPVILGSLYSSTKAPPYKLAADNDIKAIVTRSKLVIEFDEKDKVTTIITPAKNKIVLSDKDKSILLQDQNDNKVELGTGGITLDSPKDIKISAKGKISVDAVGEISLSSKAALKGDGLEVSLTAQTSFVGKGSASAEVSASGTTTIKGAMVMIN